MGCIWVVNTDEWSDHPDMCFAGCSAENCHTCVKQHYGDAAEDMCTQVGCTWNDNSGAWDEASQTNAGNCEMTCGHPAGRDEDSNAMSCEACKDPADGSADEAWCQSVGCRYLPSPWTDTDEMTCLQQCVPGSSDCHNCFDAAECIAASDMAKGDVCQWDPNWNMGKGSCL